MYLNRRQFIQAAGGTAAATALGVIGADIGLEAATPAPHGRKLENVKPSAFSVDQKVDKPNRWEDITTYNNYYEFGTDKDSPSMSAGKLKPEPWTVTVEGECNKKAAWHIEDILKGQTLEERIYRHRCVEALVDGDSVGRLSAVGLHQEVRADVEGEVRRVHDARTIRSRCPARDCRCCAGRTSKACAWTRRCTR